MAADTVVTLTSAVLCWTRGGSIEAQNTKGQHPAAVCCMGGPHGCNGSVPLDHGANIEPQEGSVGRTACCHALPRPSRVRPCC
jgi:hypothetical protein